MTMFYHRSLLYCALMLALFIPTISFATNANLSAIGNYVWLDEDGDGDQSPGEAGIPNVRITLKDGSLTPIQTISTGFNGEYKFNDLAAGVYYVVVDETSLPNGLSQQVILNPRGDFGNQSYAGDGYKVKLLAGEENLTADFGFNWGDANGNTGTGALGNMVWSDANGNGLQDPGEPGLGGVGVSIYYDSNGNSKIDADDNIYIAAIDQEGDAGGSTVTRKDGHYVFHNLPTGLYAIVVDENTPSLIYEQLQTGDPDEFGQKATAVDGRSKSIMLAPGDAYLNVDFGYMLSTAGSISGEVWIDCTVNFFKDANEPAGREVSITLVEDTNGNGIYDSNEPSIASTLTDFDGNFSFTGLPSDHGAGSANYILDVNDAFDVLQYLVPNSDSDGLATANQIAVTLTPGSPTVTNSRFSYILEGHSAGTSFLSSYVYIDGDRNSTFTRGEGVENIQVVLNDNAGNKIATTFTNKAGQYFFGGLTDQLYKVKIAPASLPPAVENSIDPDNNGVENETNFAFTFTGEHKHDQNFGYGAKGLESRVGNQIWNDTNANGTVDQGESLSDFANITIDIYLDRNYDGLVNNTEQRVASTVTDANGAYVFDNLPTIPSGTDYIIQISDHNNRLNGYWHQTGTSHTDGQGQAIPLVVTFDSGDHDLRYADFAFYHVQACVGNQVWNDTNNNGIQDSGTEPGIEGVAVTLEIAYPDGTTITYIDSSDVAGAYSFMSLMLDEDHNGLSANEPVYTLSADATTRDGLVASEKLNMGSNPNLDSDDHTGVLAYPVPGDMNIGLSNTVTQVASYDFGYSDPALPAELIYFDGDEVNCSVHLRWATAMEYNTAFFQIERSTNGKDYAFVAKVPAAHHSMDRIDYNYADENYDQINYYRLKQVDTNGAINSISMIVPIKSTCTNNVPLTISKVFPNPAVNTLQININQPTNESGTWSIKNNMGREVMGGALAKNSESTKLRVDVSELAVGVYYIEVISESYGTTEEFIKIN